MDRRVRAASTADVRRQTLAEDRHCHAILQPGAVSGGNDPLRSPSKLSESGIHSHGWGSADGSADIIRKYSDSLACWESGPDRGQSHAINKGFSRASGEIFCWLNSDDYLEPGALQFVGEYFSVHPECQWLVGRCRIVDAAGNAVGMYEPHWPGRDKLLRFWEADGVLPQPASFWRRELMDWPLREDLHFAMDYELWLRFSTRAIPHVLPDVLANYRLQEDAKTVLTPDKFLPNCSGWRAPIGGHKESRIAGAWKRAGAAVMPKDCTGRHFPQSMQGRFPMPGVFSSGHWQSIPSASAGGG